MDLAAELARFNPDPALANWITGALQQHLDQTQQAASDATVQATRLAEQITRRDSELISAQTKIQALTLELAHLRRMRFGVRNEALTAEQRDLFQETLASDLAATEAELAKRAALVTPEPLAPRQPRPRAGRQPLPEHLPRIEHRHEPESCACGPSQSASNLPPPSDLMGRVDCACRSQMQRFQFHMMSNA